MLLPKENLTGNSSLDRAILEDPDWVAAKTQADEAAAERVIPRLWKNKKTEALKSSLRGVTDVIFISQPSTSGMNVLPRIFAKLLAQQTAAEYCDGDRLYNAAHSQQIKHIPRLQRPFNPRDYVTRDLQAVKSKLSGKTVILVEDLLTTGGSVKDFIRALEKDGIFVSSVVALAGDRRLQVDEKTRLALHDALKAKSIELSADDLANNLTRTEAGGIILLVKNVRTENAKSKLTGELQGILDQGALERVGGDKKPERDIGSQGKDTGHERDANRIQAGDVRNDRGGKNCLAPESPTDPQAQYNALLDSYIQEKYEQAQRIGGRLQELIDRQQALLDQYQSDLKGMNVFKSRKRSGIQRQIAGAQACIARLENRLEHTREITGGRTSFGPKIEQLAHRKLRLHRPDLAARRDAALAAERHNQVEGRRKKNQIKELGRAFGRSR